MTSLSSGSQHPAKNNKPSCARHHLVSSARSRPGLSAVACAWVLIVVAGYLPRSGL